MSALRDLLREAFASGERDLTRVALPRAVLLLSIPMVIEMGMEATFSLVDVYFVSKLGSAAVAAVGLTEAMLIVVYAFGFGLGIPATAVVARRIGEKDADGAAVAAVQAIGLGLVVSIAVAAVGIFFGSDLLVFMGAEPEVAEIGGPYVTLLFTTGASILLLFLNGSVLRAAGDASRAMRALVLANGINMVLDPCLIFGLGPFPELGLFGAAVATSIGRTIGVVYQLSALLRGTGNLKIAPRHLRYDGGVVRTLLGLSVGAVGQNIAETASWLLLARIVAMFGSTALAGYTVTMRLVIFFLLPGWGIANAASTLVGQHLGAKQAEKAADAAWLTGRYNMYLLAGLAIFFHFLAPTLVAPFSDDPAARAIAANGLRIVGYGCIFYAWGMVLVQAFNGAGDTLTPLFVNVICFWCFKLPLAYALATMTDEATDGIWLAAALAYSLSAVISLYLFRRGRWKERTV